MRQAHNLPKLLNKVKHLIGQVINMGLHACCDNFLLSRHKQCLSSPSTVPVTNQSRIPPGFTLGTQKVDYANLQSTELINGGGMD